MPTESAIAHEIPRVHDRHPVLLDVEFRADAGDFIRATTLNVSFSGMFVQTSAPLPRGSRIFFKLKMPESQVGYHLEGEVIWCNKRKPRGAPLLQGMGIRFTTEPPQHEKILQGIFSAIHDKQN